MVLSQGNWNQLGLSLGPWVIESNAFLFPKPSLSDYTKFDCIAYSISREAETRDRALSFSRKDDYMRWFSVVFLTNGVVLLWNV